MEPFGNTALTYVTANSTRIGRNYIKALFIEYTDGNFTTVKVFNAQHIARNGTESELRLFLSSLESTHVSAECTVELMVAFHHITVVTIMACHFILNLPYLPPCS